MKLWSRSARTLGTMVVVTAMAMGHAAAAPVIFTNEADFNAALAGAGLTTETESFEGVEPGIHGELDFGAFVLRPSFLNFVSDDPADASDGTNSLAVLALDFLPSRCSRLASPISSPSIGCGSKT